MSTNDALASFYLNSMLVNYSKTWEGSSLTTPANGVIVFHFLKNGSIKEIWIRVQEPVIGPLRWAVYYSDGTYITDFRIEIGQTIGGSTLPDGFTVAMLEYLRVDLIETNGGTARIPVVFEIAIEEAVDVSFNELQDVPETFPPSAHDHDLRYYTETEIDTQSANYQYISEKNQISGYAGLDGSGKVASAQLPSYVDDVIEVANFASLPLSGETGKIYVTLNNNKAYRWSGSVYIEIVASPGSTDAVPEGSTNLYFTGARVLATLLTGYTVGSNAILAATDSILVAFGKIQAQLNAVLSKVLTGLSLATSTDVEATDSLLVAIGKLQAQITLKGEVPWSVVHRSTSVALNLSSHRVINTNTSAIGAITLTIPDGTAVTLVPGVTETMIFHSGVAHALSFEVPTGSAISVPDSAVRYTAGTYAFPNNQVGQFLRIRYIGSFSSIHEWVVESMRLSGFASLPLKQNIKSSDYSTVLGDSGREIYHPNSDHNDREWYLDIAGYEIGTAITFTNMAEAVITLTSGDVLYYGGVLESIGSILIPQNNTCTAIKKESGVWLVSGSSGIITT